MYIHSVNELLSYLSWSDLYYQLVTEYFDFPWSFVDIQQAEDQGP